MFGSPAIDTPGNTPVADVLNFAAGQASQSFTVPLTNDSVAEFYENLTLTLSGPANTSLGNPSAALLYVRDQD